MAHDFVDPYLDADASILRNLVGATNYDELLNAEGELVALRTNEFLEKLPLRPSGSMDDFLFIHRFLFQDIYDWAGNAAYG